MLLFSPFYMFIKPTSKLNALVICMFMCLNVCVCLKDMANPHEMESVKNFCLLKPCFHDN